MANKLLSADQLAEQLSVAPTTVLLWVERLGLPCIRFSKRTIRFDPGDVERWLARRGNVAREGKGGAA